MFKVGDKVKCTQDCYEYFTEGFVYTVKSVVFLDNPEQSQWLTLVQNNFGGEDACSSEYFELVQEEKPTADNNLGIRYNAGKLRWRNVPMFFLKPVAEVGAMAEARPDNPVGKYETYNYLKGLKISDTLDSMKRHLEKFESPFESDFDKETKLSHLAHIAWNALAALHTLNTRSDLDDRFKLPVQDDLKAVAEEIQRRR